MRKLNWFAAAHALLMSVLPALILGFSDSAIAQFWSEYWQQYSHRKTNYSDVIPEKRQNFSILISTLRVGYRLNLHKADSANAWRYGLDGFLRFENVHDFLNSRRFHDNIYSNNYKLGGGLKLHLQREWKTRHWLQYLQMDLFTDWQNMETFVDRVRYWFDFIEQSNWRVGINAWANSGKLRPIRQETYFDLSYHSTNFSDPGKNPYLILTLSPRVYYHGGLVDIYLNEELVKDFLNEGNWNRNPFSNNLKTIVGLRLVFPFGKNIHNKWDQLFGHASLLLFTEYSRIHFLDDVHEWPFQTELANHDYRFGFIFWWPLGEARYRPIGQSY